MHWRLGDVLPVLYGHVEESREHKRSWRGTVGEQFAGVGIQEPLTRNINENRTI